ncbi:MAG: twin-arginine translocation signal domain-containing protein, partial [Acidobacteria bacterium]|nr:twin-arginine translocation signal domain-containing protein [Acidobacteriota bacterium]
MINRREFVKAAGTAAAVAALADLPACALAPQRKPNIIFIMADDLG